MKFGRHLLMLVMVGILAAFVTGAVTAGSTPEVTSHTAQLLGQGLSLNIQWQSENPVTKVKVIAGREMKEVAVDEYDNRRNPSGYSGEVALVVPIDQSQFQGSITYQIQLEDDLRQKSSLFTGTVAGTVVAGGFGGALPPGGYPGGMAPPGGFPGGMAPPGAFPGGAPPPGAFPGGMAPPAGNMDDDNWGKENIRAGKGQATGPDGRKVDMVDKLLAVAERFDTPPVLEEIKVNVLGPENVTFSSRANDDKGLRDITFRVYDGVGNKAGEQVLSNLGKKWEGSTQPIKLSEGGTYRVVAQAVDTKGNTSKEMSATFVMKGAPPPTTLVVTLAPPEAVTAGAQWQLDGGAWQPSAASVSTTVGSHKLTFKDAAGWTTPAVQDVVINEGANTAAGAYTPPAVQNGRLAVTLVPAEAVTAGAQWQADGGAWQPSDALLTLPQGSHQITFREVAGWTAPAAQPVEVKEGDNKATATYVIIPPKTGALTVTLLPAEAAAAGRWTSDGGAPQASDATVTLDLGTHKVVFSDIPGWGTPVSQDVIVAEGPNKAQGVYTPLNGTVSVKLVPVAAATAGAQWRIAGGAWQNNGDAVSVAAGQVQVEFKDLPDWKTPAPLNLTVTAANRTDGSGGYGKVFTSNSDFEAGQLVGLENQSVKDQLQLSKTSTTLPFFWVPNSGEGTISKIDTRTGEELGRYRTGPTNGGNPSRTTVDLKGNCWVGNRNTGTAVKVGLSENGQCLDRNNNGSIETSNGSTALAWGQDECVLLEVALNKGTESTHTPGVAGAVYGGSGPRGIAVDKNNNLWVGTFNSKMFYYIDGASGAILQKLDTSSKSHGSYGALIDQSGILWSADINNRNLLRLDPATNGMTVVNLGHQAYGLGLDKAGDLYVAGWTDNVVSKVSTSTGQILWKKSGEYGIRGVAVTNDGDVWTANSISNSVTRWGSDGTRKASIAGMNHPTGVAVDADGKVWVTNYNDNKILRIDPATNAVELNKPAGGSGHYGYSDMTGIVARSLTARLGTWTLMFDGGENDTLWDTVSWNGSQNANATIKVRGRVSNDQKTWSNWEDASSAVPLKSASKGRYIQVETSLQLLSGETSPVLSDLTVTAR